MIKNMNNEIYIFMDDSGKLNLNENSCIYGGLFSTLTKIISTLLINIEVLLIQ